MSRHNPSDLIVAVNAGSSSLKYASYGAPAAADGLVRRAAVEDIGHQQPRLWIRDATGSVTADRAVDARDHRAALEHLIDATRDVGSVAAVGHRIVHGGLEHRRPERITPAVLNDLDAFVDIDPLHLPAALSVIRFARAAFPDACQVACFDTAFHRFMPAVATRYALPEHLVTRGIQKYGFHGLVAESVTDQLPDAGRMIIAHLGSGVSVTAVRDGLGLDTTMGMTPAGGVMMATRPGDLDPGVMLHLVEHEGYTPDQLRDLLSHRSGLYGVSGSTANMRELLAASNGDSRAALAVDMFCYQVAKAIGAMTAVLDGVDTLVFSGGIGERSPRVRARITDRLGFCGVRLDDERNRANAGTISPASDQVTVRVVRADEERIIAGHTRALLDEEDERPSGH